MVLTEQDQLEEEEDEDDEDEDEDDEDDEAITPDDKNRAERQKEKTKQCTVLVELMQKNRRKKDKVHFLHIAFHVYKVKSTSCITYWTMWVSAPLCS